MLPKSFYTRTDVVQISKDLLGKVLVSQINGQLTSGIIVETEAYRAPDDKACHAYNNKYTNRTKVMFEEGKKGMAQAVLIRAIEPLDNVACMLQRRNKTSNNRQLTGGPGIMSKALGITTNLTGSSLISPTASIWIEDRNIQVTEDMIIASPRVGVGYAEECALWDWRFRIKGNKWTSPAK